MLVTKTVYLNLCIKTDYKLIATMFRSECWALDKICEIKMEIAETRMLRWNPVAG